MRPEPAAPGPGRHTPARVLYLSYDGALTALGQSQVVPHVEGLAQRGHAVTLLSWEQPEDAADTGATLELRRRLQAAGVDWHPLRYHPTPRLLATAWDILAGYRLARRVCPDADVIHARSYIAASIGLALRRRDLPLVFDMRGFWLDERVETGSLSARSPVTRTLRALERRLLRQSDHVVVLSQAGRRELAAGTLGVAVEDGRMTVLPCAVDLERFRPSPASEHGGADRPPALLLAGGFGTWQRPEAAFRLFAACRERRAGTSLRVLATSGHDVIRAAARAASIDDGDYTLGRATHAEMPGHLAAASAGIFLYQPGFSKRASCPIKLGEFLACGRPVVVNEGIGDAAELVREHAVGVVLGSLTPDATEAAADALLRLLADPGLADRCRAAAESGFDLGRGCDTYSAIYRRLVPPRVGSR